MSFLSFSHVLITDEFIRHVCQGEPENPHRGGHLFGVGREGKTEFPENWDVAAIVRAMSGLLEKPENVRFSGTHIYLRKTWRGVLIELKLVNTKNQLVPTYCFPVSGAGVIRNVSGRRVSLDIHAQEEGE